MDFQQIAHDLSAAAKQLQSAAIYLVERPDA